MTRVKFSVCIPLGRHDDVGELVEAAVQDVLTIVTRAYETAQGQGVRVQLAPIRRYALDLCFEIGIEGDPVAELKVVQEVESALNVLAGRTGGLVDVA